MADMTFLPVNIMEEDGISPVNLSDRINSENDDIAFTINKTDRKISILHQKVKIG